ncbi:MAG: menaquinone biosynthesis protein [Nitrospirota bacterium]
MKGAKLIIGKIPYANLFPLFYYLENKCRHSNYKFVSGAPSVLNKLLRNGKIDISPSSSIEFLRYKDKYSIIPWISVSSSGPIGSIFLFSTVPIESLNKKTIAVSSHSETSVALLKIILKEFLSLDCRFKTITKGSLKEILKSFPAVLLIGDEAMKAKKQSNPPSPPFGKGGMGGFLYTYDLGELWFKTTGLPFVFALWMVRKKTILQKRELIKKLFSDLIKAKHYIRKSPLLIARHAPQRKWLSIKELIDYWNGISFDFTDKHLEGLRLFEKYALKTKLKK